ncbi:MAG: hypothetical protein OZSIB_4057 [Candidatus Ozemobacter sibiricus]|uniref:Uncharacterized protein n=1 Tax=Candidatus Ozemobacter sibiricus TaxID=2268124 RepID=A0A367ZAY4_9BACT|nr:MAG: hypothetical protein OZSIB_4057 [Candidatus Ozemobacter sibiricus]
MFRKPVLSLLLAVLFLLLPFLQAEVRAGETVTDLTKAYEIWKNEGIRFVIRDAQGGLVSWGIGKLESWAGESKWVVRNPKGQLMTHARGKVENWKNGKTRLVLRTPKGQILTHIAIDLSSKASFAQNVVGLRRLKDSKFLAFVQETLGELLVKELKGGDLIRTRVLMQYLDKYHDQPGAANFKPVLQMVIQQLNFMVAHGGDAKVQDLASQAKAMLSKL